MTRKRRKQQGLPWYFGECGTIKAYTPKDTTNTSAVQTRHYSFLLGGSPQQCRPTFWIPRTSAKSHDTGCWLLSVAQTSTFHSRLVRGVSGPAVTLCAECEVDKPRIVHSGIEVHVSYPLVPAIPRSKVDNKLLGLCVKSLYLLTKSFHFCMCDCLRTRTPVTDYYTANSVNTARRDYFATADCKPNNYRPQTDRSRRTVSNLVVFTVLLRFE